MVPRLIPLFLLKNPLSKLLSLVASWLVSYLDLPLLKTLALTLVLILTHHRDKVHHIVFSVNYEMNLYLITF